MKGVFGQDKLMNNESAFINKTSINHAGNKSLKDLLKERPLQTIHRSNKSATIGQHLRHNFKLKDLRFNK